MIDLPFLAAAGDSFIFPHILAAAAEDGVSLHTLVMT
jgi:hypothetical protein